MNCGEVEVLLADYLDGTLSTEEQAALEHHTSACVSCRSLLEDASAAVRFLKRAEDVTPPPELITRIAYGAPLGRVRLPFERQSLWSRLTSRWLQPVLQPRLAMGMAMTILSFAMLERCTGLHVQHLQAADLNPVRIWGGVEDRALRVKDRAVKYYENLRWVYEVETRLKSLQEQQEAAEQAQQATRSRKSKNNGAAAGSTQNHDGRAPEGNRQ
jgi:anti-sigma factor RsiW